ncbi:MAG: uncharacterized protein QOH14_2316 [Pseudonocardiales bacterium]|nr:uncharacterized protein [Pseudonocardiales bacterium]
MRRQVDGPLGEARERTLRALGELVAADAGAAAAALLLPPGVARDALAANSGVPDAPSMPALRRYSGVVYDGLALDTLTPAAQRVAARCALIFSGLLGVVRGDEPVPAYRVPAKAVLPGIGVVGTFWRPVLDDVLPAVLGTGLVVDLRSSDYAAMWRPRGALAERMLRVRVLSPVPRGGHGVVSYSSKLAKGRLCAALATRLASGGSVATAEDVAEAWLSAGGSRWEAGRPGHLIIYTG